jgi:hypothetical protein
MKNYSIIDDKCIDEIIGSIEYRRKAVEEVIQTGRTAYGPIELSYDSDSEMIIMKSFFKTTLSMRYYKRGENILYEKLRKDIDEIIKEEACEQLVEDLWE